MTHYFFTRIACDAATINKSKARDDKHIKRIIETWVEDSSRFYDMQTISRPNFTVILRYSDIYKHLLEDVTWPSWSVLTNKFPNGWCRDNVPRGEHCTMSRVDADDSYSTDFFEYLERLPSIYKERTMVLHKKVRHFDVLNGKMSEVMVHNSPMFSTIYFPEFPGCDHETQDKIGPMLGVMGNHGHYHENPHEESDKCYAINRITGYNAVTRWGVVGRRNANPSTEGLPDPRFICGI